MCRFWYLALLWEPVMLLGASLPLFHLVLSERRHGELSTAAIRVTEQLVAIQLNGTIKSPSVNGKSKSCESPDSVGGQHCPLVGARCY